ASDPALLRALQGSRTRQMGQGQALGLAGGCAPADRRGHRKGEGEVILQACGGRTLSPRSCGRAIACDAERTLATESDSERNRIGSRTSLSFSVCKSEFSAICDCPALLRGEGWGEGPLLAIQSPL